MSRSLTNRTDNREEPADSSPSLAQAGLSSRDVAPYDDGVRQERLRVGIRLATAVSRGAAAGAILKGGLHLSSWLMHLIKASARQNLNSLSLGRAIADTSKYTAFLGSLAGLYVAVDEALAAVFGKNRSSKWRALIAGLVAAQALRLTGRKQRHYGLASYVLLRGLTLLVRTGNKPDANPIVRTLLTPTRSKHGDSVLMCLASSQILYSFIMMPTTLPAAYVHFITKQGNKGEYVWRAIQEQAIRNSSGLSPGPLESLVNTPLSHLNLPPACDIPVPCAFFHPGQTCHGHALSLIPYAYIRSLSVYLPVYIIPALLVHRARLLTEPSTLLPKLAAGIARSSAFLALFISSAFGGACIGFNLFGFSTGLSIAASVWLGGLSVFAEKKSRRMELAIYCMSRAQEAASRCFVEWGWVNPAMLPARLDILLFALGCGAISHCYSDDHGKHRDVFRSKYLNVLDIIFGNSGVEHGSISHTPTNRQLISTMSKKMLKTLSRQMLDITEAASADMGFDANAPMAFSSSNALAQEGEDLDPLDPSEPSPTLVHSSSRLGLARNPSFTAGQGSIDATAVSRPRRERSANDVTNAVADAFLPLQPTSTASGRHNPQHRSRRSSSSSTSSSNPTHSSGEHQPRMSEDASLPRAPSGISSRRSSVSQSQASFSAGATCGLMLMRQGSLARSPPMLPSSFNPLVPTAPIPRIRWGSYNPETGIESVMVTPEESHSGGGAYPLPSVAESSTGGGASRSPSSPSHAASPFSGPMVQDTVHRYDEEEVLRIQAGVMGGRRIHSIQEYEAPSPAPAGPPLPEQQQQLTTRVSAARLAIMEQESKLEDGATPTVADSISTLASFTMRGVSSLVGSTGMGLLRFTGLAASQTNLAAASSITAPVSATSGSATAADDASSSTRSSGETVLVTRGIPEAAVAGGSPAVGGSSAAVEQQQRQLTQHEPSQEEDYQEILELLTQTASAAELIPEDEVER